MPATLYLRPQPRAYFLITSTHALVFRKPHASETKASRSVVVAEFVPRDEVDTRDLILVGDGERIKGVLGVTSVPTGTFTILYHLSYALTNRTITGARDILAAGVCGVCAEAFHTVFFISPS